VGAFISAFIGFGQLTQPATVRSKALIGIARLPVIPLLHLRTRIVLGIDVLMPHGPMLLS
jgi:hypothetical protein